MLKRRRFKQSSIFEYRAEEEAINLRNQAEGMPAGIRREELLRKAHQAETARYRSKPRAIKARHENAVTYEIHDGRMIPRSVM
jgi:hypothetical protein